MGLVDSLKWARDFEREELTCKGQNKVRGKIGRSGVNSERGCHRHTDKLSCVRTRGYVSLCVLLVDYNI